MLWVKTRDRWRWRDFTSRETSMGRAEDSQARYSWVRVRVRVRVSVEEGPGIPGLAHSL